MIDMMIPLSNAFMVQSTRIYESHTLQLVFPAILHSTYELLLGNQEFNRNNGFFLCNVISFLVCIFLDSIWSFLEHLLGF